MNILDYIILIPLIYFTVKGVLRGFFKEAASLAGIVLGIWLGNVFQPDLSRILYRHLPDSNFIPLISLAIIFAVVLILCNLAGWGLRALFKKTLLGWFDKVMGGVFAVLKTVVLAYFAIIILTFYVPAKAPLITESLLAPWIIKSYQSIAGLVSPDHYNRLKKKILGKTSEINSIIFEKEKK
ncbi:MAG: CvpA family protein [Deltaproteobacteria bacterium]|nr:CvpA family protein [Deltaproteobacteria bacterium]